MPGFEFNPQNNSLGLGRFRPTPSAVPSGGFNGSIQSPRLNQLLAQQKAQQGAQAMHVGHPLRVATDRAEAGQRQIGALTGGGNPMLRRPGESFMPGEYRALHPTGGVDSVPGRPGLFGESGAAGYGQGLLSMAGRNLLERNLANHQVNHHLGMVAALAGRAAPQYQTVVGGAHPTHEMEQTYSTEFPSSAVGRSMGNAAAAPPLPAGHNAWITPPQGVAAMAPTPPAQPGGFFSLPAAGQPAPKFQVPKLPAIDLSGLGAGIAGAVAKLMPQPEAPQLAPGITQAMIDKLPVQPRFGMGAETGRQAIGGRLGDHLAQALLAAPGPGPDPGGGPAGRHGTARLWLGYLGRMYHRRGWRRWGAR